tara:strand:+ start:164 stop:448 length:285 start_codon:yes stop_codon:yes gene_type:complete
MTKHLHNSLYFEENRNGYTANKTIDSRVPSYYIGSNGYEARKVVDNFDLSYNIGTAVTYLIRAERKHDTPINCIKKAIAHLEFELERINDQQGN